MPASRLKSFNYAVGMFGTSIPINMLKTYAAYFYVDMMGLTTKNVATILFIYTFIDAIDNPVYGFFSDRTRTRWGRRRPWLVVSTPLMVLGLVFFYNPPADMPLTALFYYAAVFYIFTGTLDSMVNANYGALFPELFTTDASRAVTNALRQAFQLLAMIISVALTPMVAGALGYGNTSIVYGFLGGAVILYMALTSREVPVREEDEKPELWHSIKSLFINRKFWIAGLANAFYSAAMSLVLASVPFFVKYALELPDSQATFLLAPVLIVAAGCVFIWAALVRKFSVIPVWRAALATLGAAFVALYFARCFTSALICSVLVGFGFSGVIATMDLIGAKIMDEDKAKYRLRREGIIASALGFMNRLNGLFVSLAFLLVNVLYGFESGEVPGSQPGSASRFLLTLFPMLLMAISLAFSFFINFKKEKAEGQDSPAAAAGGTGR